MFIKKEQTKKESIDELNARIIGLAKALKDVSNENKELKAKARLQEKNIVLVLKANTQQAELINDVNRVVNSNTYNNEKAMLGKIKELVRDYQSKKLTQLK